MQRKGGAEDEEEEKKNDNVEQGGMRGKRKGDQEHEKGQKEKGIRSTRRSRRVKEIEHRRGINEKESSYEDEEQEKSVANEDEIAQEGMMGIIGVSEGRGGTERFKRQNRKELMKKRRLKKRGG